MSDVMKMVCKIWDSDWKHERRYSFSEVLWRVEWLKENCPEPIERGRA